MRARLVAGALALLALGAAAAAPPAWGTRDVAVAFRSRALDGPMHASVVLPPGYDTARGTRYPVVYFLHGLPSSPTAYRDVGWLERALAQVGRPAILVSPQGARSADSDPEYLNWGPGRNWEDFVTSELVAYVDAHFRTIRDRSGRALVGLSAGGYGASVLGFNHPDRFSVIESWSGYFHATDPTGRKALRTPPRTNVHVLVERFAAYVRRHPALVAFYVGGDDDRFRAENVALDRELDAARVPHLFTVYPGGHETAIWRRHAVSWLGLALRRLAPATP